MKNGGSQSLEKLALKNKKIFESDFLRENIL